MKRKSAIDTAPHSLCTAFVAPSLWLRVWHAIQMCEGQLCQVGTHQFSIDGGRQWFYTGTAYTSLVHYTDGTSHLFDRRERPHLVFVRSHCVSIDTPLAVIEQPVEAVCG